MSGRRRRAGSARGRRSSAWWSGPVSCWQRRPGRAAGRSPRGRVRARRGQQMAPRFAKDRLAGARRRAALGQAQDLWPGTLPITASWRGSTGRRPRASRAGPHRCSPQRSATSVSIMCGVSCAPNGIHLAGRNPRAVPPTPNSRPRPPPSSACTPRRRTMLSCSRSNTRSRLSRRWNAPRAHPNSCPMAARSTARRTSTPGGGNSTLFTALDVATAEITAQHTKRRRRVQFLAFMNAGSWPTIPTGRTTPPSRTEDPQAQSRSVAGPAQERPLPLHPDPRQLAQPGRDLCGSLILAHSTLDGASFTSVTPSPAPRSTPSSKATTGRHPLPMAPGPRRARKALPRITDLWK